MSASILAIGSDRVTPQLPSLNVDTARHRVHRVADADADALLLECDAPLQSGIVLMRRRRAQAATRALPSTMPSARSCGSDIILALESGADYQLPEPSNRFVDLQAQAMVARAIEEA